jgi:two-component system, OmpR family, sensor kinase
VKLAARISLFFLIALAAVLVGFSSSIYWFLRAHLHRQLNDAAVAAVDTLSASIEFTADGLEWEPSERRLSFGATGLGETLVWGLFDGDGNHIDGTTNGSSMLTATRNGEQGNFAEQEDATWDGELWRISRRALHSEATVASLKNDKGPATRRYDRLYIAVGVPLEPVVAQVRALALTLAGISIAVWMIAALLGGWLCRNALAPLTHMSNAISAISPADLSQRLSPIATKDQLGKLSHSFNQLLNRLEASFDRQRRFAADASHQLRTPLTAMLGHVEVALRRPRSIPEYQSVLENVQLQSTKLNQIIGMLLFLAREGSDVIGADCHCFELNEWLDEYLPQWRQHPRFSDLRLDVDRDAELLIRAHSGLLGQAIDNLIDNACKYSEPTSQIVVRTTRNSEFVMLEVEDNGYGIPESELPRIFDPFFRSDDARRRGIGGAGLGLSVTHQIISAFDAKLSIESTPERGSIAIVVFRAHAAESSTASVHAGDEAEVANET